MKIDIGTAGEEDLLTPEILQDMEEESVCGVGYNGKWFVLLPGAADTWNIGLEDVTDEADRAMLSTDAAILEEACHSYGYLHSERCSDIIEKLLESHFFLKLIREVHDKSKLYKPKF